MSVLPPYPSTRSRTLTPYTLFWAAVGCLALVYLLLFLFGAEPDLFSSVAQTTPSLERKLEQTQRDMARGFADIEPVRQTLGEVKMDVANLKIAAQEASERDRILMQKVAALETSTLKPQDMAAQPAKERTAAPIVVPPTPRPDPRKSAATGNAQEEAVSSAAAPKDAKVANAEQKTASPIETGSISRPVKVVTVPKPTAAKKPLVGVLLATGASVDTLRLNWSILTDRHPDAVKNLQPRYIVNGTGDRTYALVAGPVKNAEAARSVCKVMEDRGLPCEVSIYRGNSL